MSSTSIVGYTYQAENLCTGCTRTLAMRWGGFDDGAATSTEALLDRLAGVVGVDRYDERSYDSDDFPKVIFDSQVEDSDERCGSCGESLIG